MTNILANKAMLVSLSIGAYRPVKTDRKVTADTITAHGAAPNTGRFLKNLMPENAVAPITRLDSDARSKHKALTLPWDVAGIEMCPMGTFSEYRDMLHDYNAERAVAIDEFLAHYAEHRDLQTRRLAGMANLADYPAVDVIRGKFYVHTTWSPMPDTGKLPDLLGDAAAEIEEHVETRLKAAYDGAAKHLYMELGERLKYLADRLRDPENVFKDSLIEGTRELCRLIPARNITGDAEIEAMRVEVMRSIASHEPEQLRDDVVVRAEAVKAADDILRKMGLAPATI